MPEMNRVLLVDDDADFAAAVSRVLRSGNYLVDLASTKEQAMESIALHKPDLVLLDVMMKKMDDGFRLCYQLKHDERYRKIPVIIISSVVEKTGLKFSPETDGEYLQADDFLHKPVSAAELLDRVERALRKSTEQENHWSPV